MAGAASRRQPGSAHHALGGGGGGGGGGRALLASLAGLFCEEAAGGTGSAGLARCYVRLPREHGIREASPPASGGWAESPLHELRGTRYVYSRHRSERSSTLASKRAIYVSSSTSCSAYSQQGTTPFLVSSQQLAKR